MAVVAGAFGAHALRGRLQPADLSVWETAARYHLIHAVALLAIALGVPVSRAQLPFGLMALGILIFSGSLYVLALSGVRWLGAVTPLGGLCMIAGWLAIAWAMRGADG